MQFIELHAHMGASTPADVMFDIAMEQGIKIGTKDYFQFMENMKVPNHMAHKAYLNKFSLTQKIQSSLWALERSAYHCVAHAYKNLGLKSIELRFNPILRSNNGAIDLDAIIEYVSIGINKAMLAFPIKACIIIETDRTFTPKIAEILAHKAVEHKSKIVCGFDMSGFTPKSFNIRKFSTAFKIAKEGGLSTTVHAGETMPAQEVIDAINYLYVDRIGHGIKLVKNKKGLRLASEQKVHFEICPTSNIVTGCAISYAHMIDIIGMFIENDISWNLNTDGSEFLNTTVKEEYIRMVEVGMPDHWIEKSQIMAKNASFIK